MQVLHVNSESASSGHIWLSSALGPVGKSNVEVTGPGRFLFATFRSQLTTKCDPTQFTDDINKCSPDQLMAIDHIGNLFRFDISRNKYRRILSIGAAPTAMTWQLCGLNGAADCAVATADGCIRGIATLNRGSQKLVAVERGHDPLLPANWLSANTSGTVLVSSSLDAAILWDASLPEWHRIRRLVMRQQIDLAGALFVPMSDFLVTAFSDASALVWQPENLRLAFRLPAYKKNLHGGTSKASSLSPTNTVARHFTASTDGRWLVAAEADGCRLIIWPLDARSPKLRSPRTLSFLNWLPSGSSSGIIQSLIPVDQTSDKNLPSSFLIALVDHSSLLGIDLEQARPLFVSRQLLPSDLPDCHSVSSIALILQRSSSESTSKKMAVLSAHSGSMFIVNESNDFHQENLLKGQRKTNHEKTQQPIKTKAKSENILHRSLALSKQQEKAAGEASCIERSALVQMLRHYGAYPNRLRPLIWRLLLKLPRNNGAFAALLDRGAHPCVSGLASRYPVRSSKLLRLLARVLSALAHWSPIFGETEFLPMFIFPFLHVYETDAMACFELIATILIGFCQHWFEYAPHPPIAILSSIENLFAHADQKLLLHLTAHQLTAQDYAWPLLQTAFSEVLAGSDWLRVWDHVIACGPAFFVAFPVSYLISSRSALMRLSETDEFLFFIRNRNALDIDRVITETYSLLSSSPSDVHPVNSARLVTDFDTICIPSGPTYPVFDKYPKYVINFRSEERERLRRDFNALNDSNDFANSSRMFSNSEQIEDRKLRFQKLERMHNKEVLSLTAAVDNSEYRNLSNPKVENNLNQALEEIEIALDKYEDNAFEGQGRKLLKSAAKHLLEVAESTQEDRSVNESILANQMKKLSPNKKRLASQAKERLRDAVSELRRDLHRRKLATEQSTL